MVGICYTHTHKWSAAQGNRQGVYLSLILVEWQKVTHMDQTWGWWMEVTPQTHLEGVVRVHMCTQRHTHIHTYSM